MEARLSRSTTRWKSSPTQKNWAQSVAITLSALAFFASPGWSSEGDVDSLAAEFEHRRGGFLPLPILFFTPETGLAGGGALLALQHTDADDYSARPSSVLLDLIYTQKKQFAAELYPDLYFQGNTYRVTGFIQYLRYPQKFFGIGKNTPDALEETYTSQSFRFSFDAVRRLFGDVSGGITMLYDNRSFADFEEGRTLDRQAVSGSRGGRTLAFGVVGYLDTRENIFAPAGGSYLMVSLRKAAPGIGSEFSFTTTSLDFRRYYAVAETGVLALQWVAALTSGDVPFYMLAQLGGMNTMRGYYDGRYRDKDMMAVQAEYRFPLYWRFGAAAFLGAGDVAPGLSYFTLRSVKPSYGCGLRYLFDPDERLSIRLDFGFGKNSSGMYIAANQAF